MLPENSKLYVSVKMVEVYIYNHVELIDDDRDRETDSIRDVNGQKGFCILPQKHWKSVPPEALRKQIASVRGQ